MRSTPINHDVSSSVAMLNKMKIQYDTVTGRQVDKKTGCQDGRRTGRQEDSMTADDRMTRPDDWMTG